MDTHTNDVMCMCFAEAFADGGSSGWTIPALVSKDGLVGVLTPTMLTKESALMLVLNIGSPVQEVRFIWHNVQWAVHVDGKQDNAHLSPEFGTESAQHWQGG